MIRLVLSVKVTLLRIKKSLARPGVDLVRVYQLRRMHMVLRVAGGPRTGFRHGVMQELIAWE